MFGMDTWDLALMAVAAYISIMTLVRMIRRRRQALVDDLIEQVEIEKQRQQKLKEGEERQRVRAQLRRSKAA
jgi:hypothetical protein